MSKALKVIAPIGILAAGALLAAVLIHNRRQVEPEPYEALLPVVRVMEIRKQDYQFTVHSQGNAAPRTQISLAPEVSGRVVAVSPSFRNGGFFEAGEVLLAIDPRDFELAVIRARAALAEARVRLAREEAEAHIARQEWETLGVGEPNPLLLREPQLAEARAAIESVEAALEQAERDLERTRLPAPFDGRVLDRNADVGGYVTGGAPVARVHSVDYAEVRLPLPLDQLAYLDLALDFRGETQARPRVYLRASVGGRTHAWEGEIVRTEGEIDPRTRMIHAVAQVKNPYGQGEPPERPALAAGLFVEAEIVGKRVRGVAVLPRPALRNGYVLVVDSENRLRQREVELLRIERDQIIVGEGLREGDRVSLSVLDIVIEGMRVRVAEE